MIARGVVLWTGLVSALASPVFPQGRTIREVGLTVPG